MTWKSVQAESAVHGVEYMGIRSVLLVSLELSAKHWWLGFGVLTGRRGVRRRRIEAWDLAALESEIERASRRFGLEGRVHVVSCYEAGRDGFSVHRALMARGIENVVVDSSSIEVPRRARRVKTDRLDVESLLRLLHRWYGGEERVWSVVRVPSLEAEDLRQIQRERSTLKRLRAAEANRIRSLLVAQGVRWEGKALRETDLARLRGRHGKPLGEFLRQRLVRDLERLAQLDAQLRAVEAQRRELEMAPMGKALETIVALQRLRGIGPEVGWGLSVECLGWRSFANRRELAGFAALCPTAYQSGTRQTTGGVGRGGHGAVRSLMIELAWLWLRYQPDSELSRWYARQFAQGSKRVRRIGIVALARKLLIALWRYVETGVLPPGAVLQAH